MKTKEKEIKQAARSVQRSERRARKDACKFSNFADGRERTKVIGRGGEGRGLPNRKGRRKEAKRREAKETEMGTNEKSRKKRKMRMDRDSCEQANFTKKDYSESQFKTLSSAGNIKAPKQLLPSSQPCHGAVSRHRKASGCGLERRKQPACVTEPFCHASTRITS